MRIPDITFILVFTLSPFWNSARLENRNRQSEVGVQQCWNDPVTLLGA